MGLLDRSMGSFEFLNVSLDLITVAALSNVVFGLMRTGFLGIAPVTHFRQPRRHGGSDRTSVNRGLRNAIAILVAAQLLRLLFWMQSNSG